MRQDNWNFTCTRCRAVCLPISGLCRNCFNRSWRRANWLEGLCILGWGFGLGVAGWIIISLWQLFGRLGGAQ